MRHNVLKLTVNTALMQPSTIDIDRLTVDMYNMQSTNILYNRHVYGYNAVCIV